MRIAILALVGTLSLANGCDGGDHDHDHDHDHGEDSGDTSDLNTGTTAMSDGSSFMVAYALADDIVVSEPFDLTLMAHDGADHSTLLTDVVFTIDANMPDHGHGMNVAPTVTAQSDGSALVEGMVFHMPGHWEVEVGVSQGDTTETAIFDIVIE